MLACSPHGHRLTCAGGSHTCRYGFATKATDKYCDFTQGTNDTFWDLFDKQVHCMMRIDPCMPHCISTRRIWRVYTLGPVHCVRHHTTYHCMRRIWRGYALGPVSFTGL